MIMNNFFLIDKPIWLTSFDVLRKLKKELNIKKMWHTWTLDPLATGVLLVAVWNYTKLIPFFEKDTKEYIFKVALDWVTESYDLEKEIDYISDEKKDYYKKNLKQEDIENILKEKFTWNIEQIPPKYSAIKMWWKKALDMVRAWEDFEMKKRKSTIFEIEVLEYSYPDIVIRAKVSAGTYIRSIAFDLWEIIWTGWYVKELRRTKVGNLDISLAQTLGNFDNDNVLTVFELFWKDRFITLNKDILTRLNHWQRVKLDENNDIQKDVDLFYEEGWNILSVIRREGDILKNIRRIN